MAVDFDGVDDDITISSISQIDDLGPLTASIWINPDTEGEASLGRIFMKAVSTGRWMLFMEGTTGVNTPSFVKDFTTTELRVRASNNALTLDVWQHLVVTWDGGLDASEDVKIYVDGVEVGYALQQDAVGSANSDSGLDLLMGNTTGADRTFDGLMEDIKIYNRVLSLGEIQTLHTTRGHDGDREGLVAHYRLMEDAPGVTASGSGLHKDESSGQNDGTPNSSPVFGAGELTRRRRVA
jgi:hypothetical protein